MAVGVGCLVQLARLDGVEGLLVKRWKRDGRLDRLAVSLAVGSLGAVVRAGSTVPVTPFWVARASTWSITAANCASGWAPSNRGTGCPWINAKLTGTACTWKAWSVAGLLSTSTVTSWKPAGVPLRHLLGRGHKGRGLSEPGRPQDEDDGMTGARRDDVAKRRVRTLDDDAGSTTGSGGGGPPAGCGASRLGRALSEERSTAPRKAAAVKGC